MNLTKVYDKVNKATINFFKTLLVLKILLFIASRSKSKNLSKINNFKIKKKI